MTRKDYEKLALAFGFAFAEAKGDLENIGVGIALKTIKRVLKQDNPRFDSLKFDNAVAKTERETIILLSRLKENAH